MSRKSRIFMPKNKFVMRHNYFFIIVSIVALLLSISALVPLGIGLGLCLGANSKYNKAIDIYNSKYDKTTMQLQWRVAPNGVGLAIAF